MANEDKLRDYLKRVMADLHDTRRRLSEAQSQELEPVAIVAMSCRLPGGVRNPGDLWELLRDGRDGVTFFPDDRGWDLDRLYHPDPDNPGTSYAREGGFVDGAGDFDAAFFGISPREALTMDPQQRLLLETSWEAVEAAGIDPASLRGSRTGVFVGTNGQDYGTLLMMSPDGDEGHSMTGGAAAVASGRVSYTLGLEGPAVSIDTACSSSLVALHLAVQALRAGECELALAGGVTVMATPGLYVGSSRQRALSPDGRCRSFAAAADGAGFSEGVGWLLVERLSDARRNGHPVLATVRGSAVNQDGASNGLTAPNGPAQRRVISQALASARLSTADVDVVEAHGTGTTLGDPIEAQALLATYGQDRAGRAPLLLGSVKSNIGHAQAAAGVAGVIKMVLAMREGVVPATLHVDAPSPHIDWSAGAVELVTEARPWPETGRPRRAAVSSFGISGTNAHVIIEQPQNSDEPVAGTRTPELVDGDVTVWPVSARSRAALAGQAERLAAYVRAHDGLDPAAVGWSLATTRSTFEHRAAVVGVGTDELLAGLDAVASGLPAGTVVTGAASPQGAGPVFVFPGQGAQSVGMAAGLVGRVPVFDVVLADCQRALAPYLDVDLVAVLTGDDESWLERVEVVQPVLWAVGVALAAVWQHVGVAPQAVVGHSQGEIGAACVAGILSLDDAAKTVALRSRALSVLRGTGAMASVDLPVEAVAERLSGYPGVGVAAVNGPSTVVVSGPPQPVADLVEACQADGVRARLIPVDYASHSVAVQEVAEQLRADLADVAPRSGRVRLVSTLTGEWVDPETMTADYWYENLRQTVRFDAAVRTAVAAGFTTFVEISPHPVLTMPVTAILDDVGVAGHTVGSLRRGDDDPTRLLTNLATAHTIGLPVDLTRVLPRTDTVDLPTYAFDHQRFWPAPPLFLSRDDDEPDIDRWRYRIAWPALPDLPLNGLDGAWLVAIPAALTDDTLVAEVLDALGSVGADVVPVEVDPTTDPAVLADLLRAALPADGGPATVLSLLGLDERAHPDHPATTLGVTGTVLLVQALGTLDVEARLWCATRRAVAVEAGDPPPNPAAAAVWGLGRAIALEHPARWGGLVDLPDTLDPWTGMRLCAALGDTGGEDQLAVRESGVHARRLTRITEPEPAAADGEDGWRMRGTVLITGGTGGLGGHLARWAARSGAAHVLLASRRGPDAPGATDLTAELTDLGVRVTVARCDVSDREQVAALLAAAPDDTPVTAVLHTAAVLDDGIVDTATAQRLHTVAAPKCAAAVHLDELTRDLDLDAFVLFSSVAGTTGNAGQGAYGAANAYLDALAERRRAEGLPALSVAWGAWRGAGLPADNERAQQRLRRGGMVGMDPELAVEALSRALRRGDTTTLIADIDWARFAPAFTLVRPSPLIADLDEVREAARQVAEEAAERAADTPSALAHRLAGLSPAERSATLLEMVRQCAATALGYGAADDIPADRPFRDLGLDSLTAVDLRNFLATATDLRLPATLAFDYPNPTVLAAHLGELLTGAAPETAAPAPATVVDDEPIAIVAMSCRLPGGADNPDQLWQLLAAGGDAIGEFPTDRGWDLDRLFDADPENEGTSYAREGGFVAGVADFDPGFFGISPREALAMDPQQRLLLEASWEAIERAGIDPTALRGSPTGVFVGTNYQDYRNLMFSAEGAEGHLMTGNAGSVLSGRVSYTLGLEGPAVSVDTACSSSLVALHWACQALRRAECSLALVGGVTVMSTPGVFVGFSRQRGLAPDGRVKAFASAADGTSWGEGLGVLLVERLSDARRNGHPVLAVVRGSALNQDGASNGLTAPNGPSQQRVIRQALANAGLTAAEVDAVEAHGTGTRLGDPIEAQALLATYGQDRGDGGPLLLGSVKSNIGHTQAAAGVAGIIKMVLALRYGYLPPTLHVDEPTDQVDWSAGAVELVTEGRPWPVTGRPRRAAVSSFGISGTNAHTILEQAPEEPVPALPAGDPDRLPVVPVLLSARTPAALAAQAGPWADQLTGPEAPPMVDVGWSSVVTRAALEHRAVVLATDRAALRTGLRALGAGDDSRLVVTGTVAPRPKVAFLFSGQGAQRAGMGRELAQAFPAFAAALDEVCAALDPHLPRPLKPVLFAEAGTDDAALLDRTEFTQPALFAVEVALFRLLETWGVRPDAVAGHSIGEFAAALAAGMLSLADAATLVAARGRLMQALPDGGAMLAVAATETEVVASLGDRADRVSVAAVNGPAAVVLSGAGDAVEELAAEWKARGVRVRRLAVSHAFHSPLMDPVLDDLAAVAGRLTHRDPAVPMISTVTGHPVDAADLDAPTYWVRHARDAVRFADAVAALREQGCTGYVEIGPDGVLTALAQAVLAEGAPAGARPPLVVPTLRRAREEPVTLLRAVAALHVHGVSPDWSALYEGTGAQRVDLPTYVFDRQRYWPEPPAWASLPAEDDRTDVERRFWAAVEAEDFDSLVHELQVDREQPFGTVLPALSAWRRRGRERSLVDATRYREAWEPLAATPATQDPGRWLVLLPADRADDPDLDSCTWTLGMDVSTVPVDTAAESEVLGGQLADVLGEALAAGDGPLSILSFLGLDDAPHAEHPALPRGLTATVRLLQELTDLDATARLWCVTQGAVGVGEDDAPVNPRQAALWGLGRVAALEQPARWAGLVDLPTTIESWTAMRLGGVVTDDGTEDQFAVRESGVLVRRLIPAATVGEPEPLRPRDTVLITGGAGALGGHVARWAAGAGAERIVLTSRRGTDTPGAAELLAELTALGVDCRIERCDAADRVAMTDLIADLRRDGPPLRAVVHAAGVSEVVPLAETTLEDLAYVVAPKLLGAELLDELLDGVELDAFVLFSSIAAAWGSGGQGAYAAGNAYLDAFAQWRRGRGLPATSVAWGPWTESGMFTDGAPEQLRRRGLRVLPPSVAMAGLRHALAVGDTCVTVADVDWATFHQLFTALRPSPLLADLPAVRALAAPAPAPEAATPAGRDLLAGLRTLPGEERRAALLEMVRVDAAKVLGHASGDVIETDRGFLDLGFDSLTAVELRNLLTAATGHELPTTVVFDYPTPAGLADHLYAELFPDSGTDSGTGGTGEEQVRRALAAIPLDRLRQAGLLDQLLQLAGTVSAPATTPAGTGAPAPAEEIRELDVAGLVRMAMEGTDS